MISLMSLMGYDIINPPRSRKTPSQSYGKDTQDPMRKPGTLGCSQGPPELPQGLLGTKRPTYLPTYRTPQIHTDNTTIVIKDYWNHPKTPGVPLTTPGITSNTCNDALWIQLEFLLLSQDPKQLLQALLESLKDPSTTTAIIQETLETKDG